MAGIRMCSGHFLLRQLRRKNVSDSVSRIRHFRMVRPTQRGVSITGYILGTIEGVWVNIVIFAAPPSAILPMTKTRPELKLLIVGIGFGVIYALVTRLVFGELVTLASITYLFIVPAVLGFVPFLFADEEQLRSYRSIVFIPWLTVGSFFIVLMVVGGEDVACLVLLAAPFLALASIGAFLYRLFVIRRKKRASRLYTIALLPFLLAPVEELITRPSEVYIVASEVTISATTNTVWENIVEVKHIRSDEYEGGFFNDIGIPRPISASVDSGAVGGQRIGNFEGGLRFVETIKRFDPQRAVSFDITVDPRSVRPRAFDQHVLNGNYFTFVDATYELTPLANGQVKLQLFSKYQLTSTVNLYGKMWGDIILMDFQDRLLHVIKKRCEVVE